MQQLRNTVSEIIKVQLSIVYNPKTIPSHSSQQTCAEKSQAIEQGDVLTKAHFNPKFMTRI